MGLGFSSLGRGIRPLPSQPTRHMFHPCPIRDPRPDPFTDNARPLQSCRRTAGSDDATSSCPRVPLLLLFLEALSLRAPEHGRVFSGCTASRHCSLLSPSCIVSAASDGFRASTLAVSDSTNVRMYVLPQAPYRFFRCYSPDKCTIPASLRFLSATPPDLA